MYKSRLKVFLGIMAAGLLLLGARTGYLQIVRGEKFRAEFERSMRDLHLLPAARGQITDRAGRILAVDVPCLDLCLDYRLLTGDPQWAARQVRQIRRAEGLSPAEADEAFEIRRDHTWRLAAQLAVDANADLAAAVDRILQGVERIRRRVQRRAGSEPVRLREEQQSHPVVAALSDEAAVAAADEVRSGRTVGAALRPGRKRTYPYGPVACHLLGITGVLGADELDRRNAFAPEADWLTRKREGYEPDDAAGLGGLEALCEDLLRGRRGYRVLDTGARQPVELEGEAPQPGQDVHLTLDIELQRALEQRIRETGHNGAAVVLTVDHSQVLASASVPTYDLNHYREGFALLAGDVRDTPLVNRAVAGRYPPGSSIKPVVALAALATGKIAPSTTFECQGYLREHGLWAGRCTGIHGTLDLHHAIMKSCNVYFYHVGDRCTLPVLCEWFRLFGLHERAGTGLPGEKAGNVPSPAWIANPRNRGALVAEAMQEGIGQGLLLVTPMHMANAMATIARDGRLRPPMLVLEGRGERAGDPSRDLPLPAGALQAVRDGMKAVVHTPGGTGYSAFHPAGQSPLDVELCGKSGTAEVPPQRADLNGDGRVEPNEIVREGKVVWFVGFAPARRPKIAFAVVLEYVVDGSGGATAGPVARDLVRWCKELKYLDD